MDVFKGCSLIQLKNYRLRKELNKRNVETLLSLRAVMDVPTPTSHCLLFFSTFSTLDIKKFHQKYI